MSTATYTLLTHTQMKGLKKAELLAKLIECQAALQARPTLDRKAQASQVCLTVLGEPLATAECPEHGSVKLGLRGQCPKCLVQAAQERCRVTVPSERGPVNRAEIAETVTQMHQAAYRRNRANREHPQLPDPQETVEQPAAPPAPSTDPAECFKQ